jgi:hypothetical protein
MELNNIFAVLFVWDRKTKRKESRGEKKIETRDVYNRLITEKSGRNLHLSGKKIKLKINEEGKLEFTGNSRILHKYVQEGKIIFGGFKLR